LAAIGTDAVVRWLRTRGEGRTRSARLAPWVGATCAALVLLDLLAWGRSFMPLSRRDTVYRPLPIVERLLRKEGGVWRVLPVTPQANWTLHRLPNATLPPNAATAYGYDSVQGYDSLFPRLYGRFAAEVCPEGYTPITNGNMVLLDDPWSPALDAAAVKWVAVGGSQEPPRDTHVRYEFPGLVLWENQAALPRFRHVAGPRVAGSVESVPDRPTGDPCRLECDVSACCGGRLVVADTFFPGWRASIDGQPTPIRLEPPAFRSVDLPQGAREVTMVYAPSSFAVGAFVTCLALALMGGWVAWDLAGRRCRAPRRPNQTSTDETASGA
jgi:hypothetical protein